MLMVLLPADEGGVKVMFQSSDPIAPFAGSKFKAQSCPFVTPFSLFDPAVPPMTYWSSRTARMDPSTVGMLAFNENAWFPSNV